MSTLDVQTGEAGRPEPEPISQPVLLSLQDVSRVHGAATAVPVHALRGVSLDVRVGELVAVMGPSGSGKSTLLHVAGGLDLVTEGEVTLDGVRMAGLSLKALAALRRRSVGYVFQDLNLIPALTAVENIMLPRELDGIRTRQARAEALAALDEVGVHDLADRFPDEMSGGQQQRVAIARALVGPRRLVLADEPTGALDTLTGESIMRVLRARVDAGAAGLLVTHDAQHAAWADRIIFLRDGEIVSRLAGCPRPAAGGSAAWRGDDGLPGQPVRG